MSNKWDTRPPITLLGEPRNLHETGRLTAPWVIQPGSAWRALAWVFAVNGYTWEDARARKAVVIPAGELVQAYFYPSGSQNGARLLVFFGERLVSHVMTEGAEARTVPQGAPLTVVGRARFLGLCCFHATLRYLRPELLRRSGLALALVLTAGVCVASIGLGLILQHGIEQADWFANGSCSANCRLELIWRGVSSYFMLGVLAVIPCAAWAFALRRARRLHSRYEKFLAIAEANALCISVGIAFFSHLTMPEYRSWSQDLALYRAGKLVERVPAARLSPPSPAE